MTHYCIAGCRQDFTVFKLFCTLFHNGKKSCFSNCGTETLSSLPPGVERGPGVGETRPPSFHGGGVGAGAGEGEPGREFEDTESSITSVSQIGRRRQGGQQARMPLHGGRAHQVPNTVFIWCMNLL